MSNGKPSRDFMDRVRSEVFLRMGRSLGKDLDDAAWGKLLEIYDTTFREGLETRTPYDPEKWWDKEGRAYGMRAVKYMCMHIHMLEPDTPSPDELEWCYECTREDMERLAARASRMKNVAREDGQLHVLIPVICETNT